VLTGVTGASLAVHPSSGAHLLGDPCRVH